MGRVEEVTCCRDAVRGRRGGWRVTALLSARRGVPGGGGSDLAAHSRRAFARMARVSFSRVLCCDGKNDGNADLFAVKAKKRAEWGGRTWRRAVGLQPPR